MVIEVIALLVATLSHNNLLNTVYIYITMAIMLVGIVVVVIVVAVVANDSSSIK